MLEVLGFEFLHNPSHAQPDHGFRSAAVSFGGASEESAGLKPRATGSCSASVSCDPRCGLEEAPQSFSIADAGLAASLACMASRDGVGNTLSTQLSPTGSGSHVITSMAAPEREAGCLYFRGKADGSHR